MTKNRNQLLEFQINITFKKMNLIKVKKLKMSILIRRITANKKVILKTLKNQFLGNKMKLEHLKVPISVNIKGKKIQTHIPIKMKGDSIIPERIMMTRYVT